MSPPSAAAPPGKVCVCPADDPDSPDCVCGRHSRDPKYLRLVLTSEERMLPEVQEDLAAVLGEVVALYQRFVAFPSPDHVHALALWVLYTHCFQNQRFPYVPYLLITSAEKVSAKSLVGEILSFLVPEDRVMGESMSAAFIGRMCAGRVVIHDEIDGVYSKRSTDDDGDAKDKRTIFNGGFKKTGKYLRLEAHGKVFEPREWSTFGPKVLIGLGSDVPDTVQSRAIPLRMERQDRVKNNLLPFHDWLHEDDLAKLREHLAFVAEKLGELDMLDVYSLPDSLTDRQKDIWLPLFTLAGLAGPPWPERVKSASAKLGQAQESVSLGVLLLRDIHAVFDEAANPAMIGTLDLIGEPNDSSRFDGHEASGLCAIEGSPWATFSGGRAPITPQRMAAFLKEYESPTGKIEPRRKSAGRSGEYTHMGYWREDFALAWPRYAGIGEEPSSD